MGLVGQSAAARVEVLHEAVAVRVGVLGQPVQSRVEVGEQGLDVVRPVTPAP